MVPSASVDAVPSNTIGCCFSAAYGPPATAVGGWLAAASTVTFNWTRLLASPVGPPWRSTELPAPYMVTAPSATGAVQSNVHETDPVPSTALCPLWTISPASSWVSAPAARIPSVTDTSSPPATAWPPETVNV